MVVYFSHERTDSASTSQDVVVVMDSFKSKIVSMKVKKREGKEDQDLLSDGEDDEDTKGGLWNSLSRLVSISGTFK